ncbi:threonine/homoserine/homoserine lactone efflux protein [Saccharothrix saharensis]|uniref:Threonine/homoserine/homoserine lactone efflux protein n=1 Tax=Saccharothrix saharensis TaxID=571190 RepID=A0A543JPJ5_9PSEU|nr:LysE family transporter [Saccharothrix saharensis]TQM84759.1 threonine/homoserine/homoserine lactone efflux protein [Saccharothrix saharensis]
MDALGWGLALGLAASISPGPLLVLVVTSALRSGRRAGALTACAPLLSDAVVVAVTLLLLDRLPARALGVLGVVGAVFVVWSGVRTVRDARSASLTAPPPPPDRHASQGSPPRGTLAAIPPRGSDDSGALALRRAVLVNLLSPHPWIAWATALGPLTITAWRTSPPAGVAFLLGFYLTLVGGKVVIAVLVARGRRRLGDTGYRRALTTAGVLLVLAGVAMGVEFATYGM